MMRQLVFIVSGFLIGQGSMFIVQSYLVAIGEFEQVAVIGIALGLLSLVQWASDGGGVFLLSRLEGKEGFGWRLPNFFIARFIFSICFYVLLKSGLYFFQLNIAVQQALCFMPVIILFWSFNLTGLIDKLDKNKLAGPFSGLNWFLCSLVVLLFSKDNYFGFYLGGAFSIGLLVTVVLQFFLLRNDLKVKIKVSISRVKESLGSILGYNLAYLSAQSYARFIPILIDSSLNSSVSGMYVYAKNVSNTVGQLVQFIRRIEFPRVLKLVKQSSFDVVDIFKVQKFSFFAVLSAVLLSFLVYAVAVFFEMDKYLSVIELCVWLLILLCIWLVSSSYGQIFVAQGKLFTYGLVVSITSIISAGFVKFLIGIGGVYAVVGIEAVMLIVQIFIYSLFLKLKSKEGVWN